MLFATLCLDELRYQVSHSNYIFNVKLLSEICDPHQKVVFFALGKSFHAAKLAVSIANSFGLRWFVIDAANALHGDAGIVGPKDILFFLSNSGSTKEVIKVASHILFNQNRKISITGNRTSSLAACCDINIELPVASEHSPFGHAPMTSSLFQILFLNELTSRIIRDYQVPASQYQQNHPAGSIGNAIASDIFADAEGRN